MTLSKKTGSLLWVSISVCLFFAVAFAIFNMNMFDAYALNSRGVVSYKNVLSEEDKVNYDNYLKCYNEFENEFDVNINDKVNKNEWYGRLTKAVIYDNPIHTIRKANLSENIIKVTKKKDGSKRIRITNSKKYNYKHVYNITESVLDNISEIFIYKEISDRGYVENLYNYLSENYSYDFSLKSNNIYEAVRTKESACMGAASMLKYLLDKEGVPNFIADGTINQGQSHVWNEVYLDGTWYCLDLNREDNDIITMSEYNEEHKLNPYEISDLTRSLIELYGIEL